MHWNHAARFVAGLGVSLFFLALCADGLAAPPSPAGTPKSSRPGEPFCSPAQALVGKDPNNCGVCGNVCPSGLNQVATCAKGVCGMACQSGWAACDNQYGRGCQTPLYSDPNNCGACGHLCSVAHGTASCGQGICAVASCDPSYANCSGACIATSSDTNNCGGCGVKCNGSCQQGKCVAMPDMIVKSFTMARMVYPDASDGVHFTLTLANIGSADAPPTVHFLNIQTNQK